VKVPEDLREVRNEYRELKALDVTVCDVSFAKWNHFLSAAIKDCRRSGARLGSQSRRGSAVRVSELFSRSPVVWLDGRAWSAERRSKSAESKDEDEAERAV
jgi:hypothetical protein